MYFNCTFFNRNRIHRHLSFLQVRSLLWLLYIQYAREEFAKGRKENKRIDAHTNKAKQMRCAKNICKIIHRLLEDESPLGL